MGVSSLVDGLLHPPPERITDSPFQSTHFCHISGLLFTGDAQIFSSKILKAFFILFICFFVVVSVMEPVAAAVEAQHEMDHLQILMQKKKRNIPASLSCRTGP